MFTIKLIPNDWKSNRLIISDLKEDEIELFQQIYETSSYMNQWSGQDYDPDYVKKCFFEGNIPPAGRKENYRIQTIKTKDKQNEIGLLNIYHGHPKEASVYIEFIYIIKNVQKQGYGLELITELTNMIAESGYKEIRVNVDLKNWHALRFWIKSGFNKIDGLYGDNEYSEKTFAAVELVKALLDDR